MAERIRTVQFAVTRPLATAASWQEAAPQVLQGICETLGWVAAESRRFRPAEPGIPVVLRVRARDVLLVALAASPVVTLTLA